MVHANMQDLASELNLQISPRHLYSTTGTLHHCCNESQCVCDLQKQNDFKNIKQTISYKSNISKNVKSLMPPDMVYWKNNSGSQYLLQNSQL